MKTLILYFTRTNTTKILAEEIGKKLNAETEEIKDRRDWSGAFGYLKAGWAALKKDLIEIEKLQNRLEDYDLIIFGMPVWVGTMPPAIRTFISDNQSKLKRVAFFAAQGSAKKQKVFSDLKELSGIEPLVEMFFTTKSVRSGNYQEALQEFIKKIQTSSK